jgi:hypothetical protein
MKEHPILFSAPMMRAILEGHKTMTRRVIRSFPMTGYRWGGWIVEGARGDEGKATVVPEGNSKYCGTGQILARCPYGQPGDRLWVRETFATLCPGSYEGEKPRANSGQDVRYAATDRLASASADIRGYTWRPSIFMPRWASRILLEVTAVRVERVQGISEEDARDEGSEAKRWNDLKQCPISLIGGVGSALPSSPRYRYGFYELWDSINARRGFGWDANPWVWVVEFRRLDA